MLQQKQEQPIYILPQKKSRALIPKILSLLGLGVVFYLGILLNLSLLNLRAGEESIVKMIGLGVVFFIFVLCSIEIYCLLTVFFHDPIKAIHF